MLRSHSRNQGVEMNRQKTIGVLSLLCAIAACAVSAGSAAASGTTLFSCFEGGAKKDFADTHCTKAVTPGTGKFGHLEILPGVGTELSASNASTKNETKEAERAVLSSVAGGLETEIVCTTVSANWQFAENFEVGGEMHVRAVNQKEKYSGCTVSKPVAQGCIVKFGEFETNSLKGESEGMTLKFSPTEGTVIAVITLEACKTAGLNKSYNLTGSFKATPEGATLNINIPRNAESSLEFGGQKAGLVSKTTLRMQGGDPVAFTTIP
jgi:hypothetical protein